MSLLDSPPLTHPSDGTSSVNADGKLCVCSHMWTGEWCSSSSSSSSVCVWPPSVLWWCSSVMDLSVHGLSMHGDLKVSVTLENYLIMLVKKNFWNECRWVKCMNSELCPGLWPSATVVNLKWSHLTLVSSDHFLLCSLWRRTHCITETNRHNVFYSRKERY